jgi:hypothetical protein
MKLRMKVQDDYKKFIVSDKFQNITVSSKNIFLYV